MAAILAALALFRPAYANNEKSGSVGATPAADTEAKAEAGAEPKDADTELVAQIKKDLTADVRNCFIPFPEAEGKVSLNLAIGPRGMKSKIAIEGIKEPEFSACIARKMARRSTSTTISEQHALLSIFLLK